MSGTTRYDLTRKTPTQLAALFNQVNQGLGDTAATAPERAAMLSLLAMICAEHARRDRSP